MKLSFARDYSLRQLKNDTLAGVTVGIIALPLSMALAIASGAPPEHGIYTSIFAGMIIAISGGARFNISGPTAAFVVVLLPISQNYGLAGLMTATLFAGGLLVALGVAKLGAVIRLIPYPVVIGFTAGIGTVIAGLQLQNFLGLEGIEKGGFVSTVGQVVSHLGDTHAPDAIVGVITLAVMLIFPKLKLPIPAHLVAIIVGVGTALTLSANGMTPKTLGSEFKYVVDGVVGHGVPSVVPSFSLPWKQSPSDGVELVWSIELIEKLAMAGFAIAMLGAIESLLCAVVADGMSGTKHDPNRELVGQGLGNLIGPFFGAIPATAALARTAANIRAGAESRMSSVVHAAFLLVALVSLAPWLSYIPMASLAALLLVVAYNMSEAKHFVHIVKVAPRSDVLVLLSCYGLTVVIDMVVAVSVGIGLASVLFIRRMNDLSGNEEVREAAPGVCHLIDKNEVLVYEIKGPLFFGAAQKAISTLEEIHSNPKTILLDLKQVTMIDMTGIVALESLVNRLKKNRVDVVMCGLNEEVAERLLRAGICREDQKVCYRRSLDEALDVLARQAQASSSSRPASSPT